VQGMVRYMQSKSGRRKVMFGSNFPMMMPQNALENLGTLGFDEETQELFLYGNARRVFGLMNRVTTTREE
jgi:predicted TIM-barrel fold metal-dependent hydrolase